MEGLLWAVAAACCRSCQLCVSNKDEHTKLSGLCSYLHPGVSVGSLRTPVNRVERVLLLARWWSARRLSTNVPVWHGACVLPHINLVTAGYQQPTSQPLTVCVCVFLQHLMSEVSVCLRVGCAAGIIITSTSIAMITAKCWRGWEGEGERRREWECIYTMRITGPDKIVESLISLPVSPITN